MNNNSYESIIFEVEKDLKKPDKEYYKSEIQYILSSTFQRGKKEEDNEFSKRDRRRIYMRHSNKGKNEPLEILHYNFDTEKKNFIMQTKNH